MNLNEFENAQRAVKKVLEIDPNFSLEYVTSVYPLKDQARLKKLHDDLRKAGLPN